MSISRTYPQGVPSWIDLEPDDVDAAAAFYGGLLGWDFTEVTPPDSPFRYLIAQVGGADAGGLGGPAKPTGAAGTAAWQTYVAVDDAHSFADRVIAAGGRIVTPPTTPGPAGTWVEYADPTGTTFRVWQAGRRVGVQSVNVPGAWNFSDLHTDDPARAKPFYRSIFGWEFDEVGFATMVRRPGYGDHLAATVDPTIHERQAAISAPPGFADAIAWVVATGEDENQHWHVSFTVADRDDSAATAERLGGKVVSSTDTEWTRDAVVRDPQGAEFTVSQFTPPT
ncbi:VOC family protein [Aldersonia sp. NBC_00410]|uniref:VOC family protein n=1 Tax=Aldersonia sp. NBC_00410 TaxID=2975954 RepID=UPI002258E9FD|nr:VOC family protein [Aldersonia sp. NBC_00410]MCX5044424.1 VOC family protein [Aldersonia sp. NBC_00410]